MWNRFSDQAVDVLDIQISRSGDTFTLNAGALDKAAHEVFWNETSPDFVEQPQCTIVVRAGALIDGKDKWWDLNAVDGIIDELGQATQVILGFFDSVHSRERMVQWLEDAEVATKLYPPPIINLAILQALLGRAGDARFTLDNLESTASGPWRGRITQVRGRIQI